MSAQMRQYPLLNFTMAKSACAGEIAPDVAKGRVIVAHLGSGASMCALAGGRSVESTMGFTALDGIPMGTRSGQIDPGVLLYMLGEKRAPKLLKTCFIGRAALRECLG